jgi:squalene-hopene/tetraprenyl-beta-curcumene cyclase
MSRITAVHRFVVLVIGLSILVTSTVATAVAEPLDLQTQRRFDQTVAKGIAFLLTQGRAEDGSYSAASGPAVTALVTTALLRNGRSPSDPAIAPSLAYLQRFAQPDGGIYRENSLYRNYETCLSMLCFREANQDGRYNDLIAKANQFVKGIQWGAEEDSDRSAPAFGGAGYGNSKRPDLSNTSFFIEALRSTGDAADSEAIKNALLFVSRCQNLESEFNDTPFAAKNPDGGFYYTAAAGGQSQAGPTETGGLRSYGSMTYAGLKSLIYAGLGPDDPRVKAATTWLQRNYRLDTNPGMGDSGLYYYYHTFSKTLSVLKQDTFVDANGKSHHWRAELIETLAQKQRPDGSWVNENSRWLEGDANLVTAYALLALSHTKVTTP